MPRLSTDSANERERACLRARLAGMSSCELPFIRVGNPGDLIDTVPYLIGFHPTESLVLVGFTAHPPSRSQQVTVTMRIDLPLEFLDVDALNPVAQAFGSSSTEAVVAIALTNAFVGDPRRLPYLDELKDSLLHDLAAMGLQVLDVLVATDTRWWSLCCDQLECCPDSGTLRERGSSAVAAELTYIGMVALPDRQALAATLRGSSPRDRGTLQPGLEDARQRAIAATADGQAAFIRGETAALMRLARGYPNRQRKLSDRQIVRFGVALADARVRDALWVAIDNGSVDAECLLKDLHSRLPVPYDAAPMFLYGWGQWRSGSGTLAAMAAERALESDPQYSAATLLIEAIQSGLDPRSTPALATPAGGHLRWNGT